jgi:hypothetical protein
MAQIANAISSYRGLFDGILEFYHCIGHLELVVNDMMKALAIDASVRQELPWNTSFSTGEDTIIIAGYSRRANDFIIRFLRYQPDINVWKFGRVRPVHSSGPRALHVFGDLPSKTQFKSELYFHLEEKKKSGASQLSFDMEPFEVISKMLMLPQSIPVERNGHLLAPTGHRPVTIGGAPQAIQVLPGASATPMVVRWASPSGDNDYLLGRRLLRYENVDLPLLTAEDGNPRIYAPWHWPQLEGIDPIGSKTDWEPPLPMEDD